MLSLAYMFPSGWTSAFVTGVYNFDSYSPSIVECLTFWVVSAMRLPGSRIIPRVSLLATPPVLIAIAVCTKVCDEPAYSPHETPCTVYDIMAQDPDAALALYLL